MRWLLWLKICLCVRLCEFCVVGLLNEYSNYLFMWNGWWNYSVWFRLVICMLWVMYEMLCGSVVVLIRWKFDV